MRRGRGERRQRIKGKGDDRLHIAQNNRFKTQTIFIHMQSLLCSASISDLGYTYTVFLDAAKHPKGCRHIIIRVLIVRSKNFILVDSKRWAASHRISNLYGEIRIGTVCLVVRFTFRHKTRKIAPSRAGTWKHGYCHIVKRRDGRHRHHCHIALPTQM